MNLQGGSFAAGWEHVMNDMFARQLAKRSIETARQTAERVERLEEQMLTRAPRPRRSVFHGKCGLCGQPSGTANYCPEHSWAEGAS